MPREAHIERQIQWKNILQEHGFDVKLEETINIEDVMVVVDVYATAEGKTFLIEIGNIDDNRKTALINLYTKQNPNIEFIHEEYGEDKTQQVLSSLSAYRESPEHLRKVELNFKQWKLRQKQKLAMLPNAVRVRIQYPKETIQLFQPIIYSHSRTDFWVITNQRLIFYFPQGILEIMFEEFLTAEVIDKLVEAGKLCVGLRISFLENGKYAYRTLLLGFSARNSNCIVNFKKNIEKYYDMWSRNEVDMFTRMLNSDKSV